MSDVRPGITARFRAAQQDPLIRNSMLMLATTLIMAAVGSIFWVLAARLAPRSDVGLASSLVATTEALAIFAQLGLNVSLLRTMPRSSRPASDVVVACGIVGLAGGVLALAYGSLLPHLAPDLAHVIRWPLLVPVFAVLVAGTAVNQLTDGIFLSINRVVSNLIVNGVLLSVVRLAAPFVLVGAGVFGSFGVFGAVGGSAVIAALLSLWAILRHLPDRPTLRPSPQFSASGRFAGAGYLSNVLYITPQLVFPVLIINAQGPAASAVFFISFQVVTLLNHVVYTVSASMYAEVSRDPQRADAIVRKAGRTIAALAGLGIVVLVAAAPLLLAVFGSGYSSQGTAVLRVLALGTVGVAFNYWSSIRLRIAHHLRAMIGVQLVTTILMVGLAVLAAPHGVEAVAGAWGVGQFVGGVLGYLVSRTIAPMSQGIPALLLEVGGPDEPQPATAAAGTTRPRPRPQPGPAPHRPLPYRPAPSLDDRAAPELIDA